MAAGVTAPGPGSRRTRTWQAWALVAVELFVAYQAGYGGVGLITDTWDLPGEWLVRTPFPDWAGPGWVLILLVGVPQVLAAIPVVAMPGRPRLGILAGLLAGISLLIWIGMQLAVLQVYFFLQPVIAVIGLVEIGLAYWWRHRLGTAAVAASSR
ncbi:MAG: hypothetical protein KDB60_06485 [Propionibacteriaceae bacterium]|nr:hypothetical protein [Propionibacteriaceae bacterium]